MARNASQAGKLDSDGRLAGAASLLAALTAAPGNRLSRHQATSSLDITDDQLDELIDLLSLVSDERTGLRIALTRTDEELLLEGNAGHFAPLRFTSDEALALTQVLERFNFTDEVRSRVHRALDPAIGAEDSQSPDGDPLFGGFYQVLTEAMAIGARVRMQYRSHADEAPVERIVDPGHIMVVGDAAYVVAWDVEKDAQRTYRLDRIAGASLTEDSVEPHPFEEERAFEGLRNESTRVTLAFSSNEVFEQCAWAGLDRHSAARREDGRVEAQLSCASDLWLFDQVLASGGAITILEPAQMREQFVAYAAALQTN